MLLYWILLPIVWPAAHILWRIEVVGKENIPRGRAHVIASNHLSDLDPVYILEAVFSWKRYTILAKQELFKNPLIGWFLSCMGAVPIDRGKGDMGTVNKVTDECKNGTPILIFPEGTRSKTGELLTLKSGAFLIAGNADADMVPCRIIYDTRVSACTCSAASASALAPPSGRGDEGRGPAPLGTQAACPAHPPENRTGTPVRRKSLLKRDAGRNNHANYSCKNRRVLLWGKPRGQADL